MKTYTIEVQKLKAASNSVNGMVLFKTDALVSEKQPLDGIEPSTIISMTEKNARVLMALLKSQLGYLSGLLLTPIPLAERAGPRPSGVMRAAYLRAWQDVHPKCAASISGLPSFFA